MLGTPVTILPGRSAPFSGKGLVEVQGGKKSILNFAQRLEASP